MIIISSRHKFFQASKIGKQIRIKDVDLLDPRYQNCKDVDEKDLISRVTGKKIAILIHGYNNRFPGLCNTYHQIETQLKKYNLSYGTVIGFAWPGGKNIFSFWRAKKRANQLKDMQADLIYKITNSADSVDVIAHSLGCYLLLQFMKKSNMQGFNNIFLMGAAIENDKINKGLSLYRPTKNCKGVYVFRSEDDAVLRTFPAVTGCAALGYTGPMPKNETFDTVRVIDCSGLNDTIKHGSYKHRSEIYKFMFDYPGISSIPNKEVPVI